MSRINLEMVLLGNLPKMLGMSWGLGKGREI